VLDWLVVAVPVLPISAAALVGVGIAGGSIAGEHAERRTRNVMLGAVSAAAVALALVTTYRVIGAIAPQVALGTWIDSGRHRIALSFTLDRLSLSFAALIAVLGLTVLRFSVNYMHREPGFHRFFAVLTLFIGAMLLLVLGGNGVVTFAGWEVAGVCSYLLIAYAYDRPVATSNATRAFVTNRIGDAGFVLGLVLAFMWCGDAEWTTVLGSGAKLDMLQRTTLAVCFLVAAMAKSAQVPLTPWVTRAMEGPTPSSAIFYGAVMIHAGVYLILRLQPIFEHSPAAMVLLVIIGSLTAGYGFFCGLTQTDVKSALTFATIGQVGLMFLTCGLGWWEIATAHLFAHTFLRTYQFLTAPSLMHHVIGKPIRPVPQWLARRHGLYVASLQRCWLEQLAEKWVVRPTSLLAADLSTFDHKVIERTIGLPVPAVSALSSLAAWEERRLAADAGAGPDTREVSGLLGFVAHKLASGLYWFEEKLVLQGAGSDLWRAGRQLGHRMASIEKLLCRPRYLFLLVLLTLLSVS